MGQGAAGRLGRCVSRTGGGAMALAWEWSVGMGVGHGSPPAQQEASRGGLGGGDGDGGSTGSCAAAQCHASSVQSRRAGNQWRWEPEWRKPAPRAGAGAAAHPNAHAQIDPWKPFPATRHGPAGWRHCRTCVLSSMAPWHLPHSPPPLPPDFRIPHPAPQRQLQPPAPSGAQLQVAQPVVRSGDQE